MSYHPVGSFFLPLDYVEFTKARTNTFFDDRAVHVDMSQPYCPELRSCLRNVMLEMNIQPFEGVYVCAEGPHLESPAQIRMMRQFGDVVGMTGYPEVVLAKELGLCYASLCIVTNEACGMKTGGSKLSLSEITDQMDRLSACVKEIISRTAEKIPGKRSCSCAQEGSSST
jgi:5'-methylthioadenosine phosphorylase